MGRTLARLALVSAAVASLGVVATTAYGEAMDNRERQHRQRVLMESVEPAVASAEFAGGAAIPDDVREYVESERRGLPFTTTYTRTLALPKGTTSLARPGVTGFLINRWLVTEVQGQRTARELLSQSVVKRPIARIVLVGTYVAPPPKPKPKPVVTKPAPHVVARPATTVTRRVVVSRETRRSAWPSVPGAEGLNWAALAECESSGNPDAVNKSGPYYGLYQFLASTWRSVGGTGLPSDASAAEQTYRAKLLYVRSGAGQWPVCGKRL